MARAERTKLRRVSISSSRHFYVGKRLGFVPQGGKPSTSGASSLQSRLRAADRRMSVVPLSAIGRACLRFLFAVVIGRAGSLQHGRALAVAYVVQQYDLAVGKFQRVVMAVRHLLVDLAEDRGSVMDSRSSQQVISFANSTLSGKAIGSRQQADSDQAFSGAAKPRRHAEVSRGELIADICRTRRHVLQAVVAHD